MKAWKLVETGPFAEDRIRLKNEPVPDPKEDQVRIDVLACGVCHTDLHVIEEDVEPAKIPLTLGHQVVGRVDDVSGCTDRFEEGDHVGVPWLHRTCGACTDCRAGRENLCKEALFTGCDVDGGFASYMIAPIEFTHPVPDPLEPVQTAPLLCGGVVGYRAFRLSEVEEGERLGLYGFGSSASMVIQAARYIGCECYVFTRSEHHRELARELGAVWTGRAEDDPGVRMHSSILFAPAGRLVPEALDQLRQGGTLAIAGIYLSPIPEMDYERYLYRERTVRSVTASTRKDVSDFLELAAEVPVEPATERFSFEQLPEALRRMKESRHQASPVVLMDDS